MVKAFIDKYMESISEKVSRTLITAASTFREDQKEAYRRAILSETNNRSKWVLTQILDNAETAERRKSPLCDDTGIPHLFLEVGRERVLSGDTITEIYDGVRTGLRKLPGRPMAVLGDDIQRIEQSEGLSTDSGDLAPSPILIKPTDEDVIRLTVLMLGGGPAIRGITHRIFHKHNIEVVKDEIIKRATEGVRKLGCTPCTLAIGIGRSQFEATSLMMEAMAYGNYHIQTDLEKEITQRVNLSNIGCLGLGGRTSVLATFAKVGPQRASGVRIVALRPCCCFEPRRASVLL